ncbi:vacuolar protein sorting/targeting protein Pep1p [Trichomonascus vanleenenianus]|uniref:vacuolar protein sorting/targeting protein 10 n=1 Tax=Trichomonascus vanleenenianus TaxID=2268995 RepID=UPI003ECB71F1
MKADRLATLPSRISLCTVLVAVLALLAPGVTAFSPKVSKTTDVGRLGGPMYFNDSSVVLYLEHSGKAFRSENDGESWKEVDFPGFKDHDSAVSLALHPYDNKRAYYLTKSQVHFATSDQGRTWHKFEIPLSVNPIAPLEFHAVQPDYLLFKGSKCSPLESLFNPDCKDTYYYTRDNFESAKELINSFMCGFGRQATGFTDVDDNAIICSVNSPEKPKDDSLQNQMLGLSTDFFASHEIIGKSEGGDPIKGVVGFGGVHGFFVAAVLTGSGDMEVNLLVSRDYKSFRYARFADDGRKITESSYTVLESSPYALMIDFQDPARPHMGDLYVSDSQGTHFTRALEHTNRNELQFVDLEKVEGVDGIFIANVIANPDGHGHKSVRTKISYDGGRTWSFLKVADGDCSGNEKCGLNLHSVLDRHNTGRIFSSPAPGILAGIGNKGTGLGRYEDGDLYISEDAGQTWRKSRDEAHLYEFGDQGNVVLAVFDEGVTDKAYYSLDRGDSWQEVSLGVKLRPQFLFTTPDSTSLRFVLVGRSELDRHKNHIVALDFEGVQGRQCDMGSGSSDIEKWYARYDRDGGEASCIMGHKQFFWRKKRDAKCYVGNLYHEQHASQEDCTCSQLDFECDEDFDSVGGKCVPNEAMRKKLANCTKGEKVKRPSGYRLIPGNTCKREGGVSLDGQVEEICGSGREKADGKVKSKEFVFDGEMREYFYLKMDEGDTRDETVVVRNNHNEVYVSHDQGGKWDKLANKDDIIGILAHPYAPSYLYLVTTKGEVMYSRDRAKTFSSFKLPSPPNSVGVPLFSFNQKNRDWIIYTGEKGCDSPFADSCETVAFYTTNNGESWTKLASQVRHCAFVDSLKAKVDERLVLCEKPVDPESNKVAIYSSDNWFKDSKKHFDEAIGFAIEHEFIVVAAIDKKDPHSLEAHISVDGKTFAAARFPHNFKIDHQQAYTILQSVTDSIFMHVTTSSRMGAEYGTLLKSNSNGTDYVISLEEVNRDADGYVDYEKMEGLEGVAICNVVSNRDDAAKGKRKQLRSMITHNDGAQWDYLVPPASDSRGAKYQCSSSNPEKCSLNLHGYTDRKDYRDTLSSQSAVGLMIGVGSVNDRLEPYADCNTFLTRDGGVTWREVAKGAFMWEFGDSGSVVVLVNDRDSTDKVLYSLDEGTSWTEYKFSDELVRVDDIATVPSDTSRRFILFGRKPASHGDKSFAVQIDFSGLADRQCQLDEENPDSDDFELWSPSHPALDNGCLFGHETLYHRKVPGRECYVGRRIDKPHKVLRNCTCTRQDFECDFNYYRARDGTCQLMPNYTPPDHSKVCDEFAGAIEWWEPTGYRRIPLSTCEGGQELDKIVSHACPGKEKEYEDRRKGLHGFPLFLVITLPIGMTIVIAYIAWDHYSKRYGQIRLGIEEDDHPVIMHYVVIAIAAVVAVVGVIPTVAKTVWGHISSRLHRSTRYTTRDAFARNRHHYAQVGGEEENELLDEDDEDIDDALVIRDSDED